MEVTLLRKDSLGIQGTYRNAEHHAQKILPIIQAIEKQLPKCGMALHKQGHNVHILEGHDGRRFDLIGFADDEGYKGVELRVRSSRSSAQRLMLITDISEVPDLIGMLQILSRPMPENNRGNFKNNED